MPRLRSLLVCALIAACASPTETGDDQAALGKAAAGPTVTSTSPTTAPQDTTLDVHVFGTGFDRGSNVAFARDGVVDPKLRVNNIRYRTSGELIANVTIEPDASTVAYDVMVTTKSGKKGIGTELFAVTVPFEPLEVPAGTSNTSDVSPDGMIAGMISTSCEPGFAPALWTQDRALIPLLALPGTCGGWARGVNGAGVAVGSAYTGASRSRSVRWLPQTGGTYVAEELPPLPDGTNPGPSSINDSGAISSGNVAAVWTETTGWQVLVLPAGATNCFGSIVGNGGQVVASCGFGQLRMGVSWASTAAVPAVLPLPAGATSASPQGVSPSGMVAGFVAGNGYRAVRWLPSGSSWTIEFLEDLGKGGSVLGMNDAGYVVGSVIGTNGFGYPAFWTPEGRLQLLYSADRAGEALGISEPGSGLVIGGYYVAAGKNGKTAVRWRP